MDDYLFGPSVNIKTSAEPGHIVNPHVFPHVAEPLPLIGDLTEKCGICRRPKGDHWLAGAGKYQCPVVTYFSPCRHERRQGSGAISVDGTGWSDETCQNCGTRLVIGNPPGYSQSSGGSEHG
jgi:hypothetical protein